MGPREAGELIPGADGRVSAGITLDNRLAAIGIVELEDRGLSENVGRAQACGVMGIALDLDRPAVDRGDQEPDRGAVELHGGGEAERLAGQAICGLRNEGDNLVFLPATARGAGQCQRRAHQLEPAATRDPRGVVGGGEFRFEERPEFRRVGPLGEAPPVRGWGWLPAVF